MKKLRKSKADPNSFYVAQKSDSPENPVIRTLYSLEPQGGDVSQICPLWFLVHRALIQTRVLGCCGVHSIHVYHGKEGEEDLRLGFNQLTATAVPAGAIQV